MMARIEREKIVAHDDINDGTEDIASVPTALAALAAKTLSTLACDDFASCREAARTVSELRFGIYRQMVERYDARDERGFADLVAFFSSLFNDKREAAGVFGISVSTFYRWKSGDTIPHALMRGTIRETIRRYLFERTFDAFEMPLFGASQSNEPKERSTSH